LLALYEAGVPEISRGYGHPLQRQYQVLSVRQAQKSFP
jgi:hypothetical protein